jgi:hypothetical protein
MAAAVGATATIASSSQLYQQALALLQQQKFDHAFVAAKRALDGAGGAAQAKPRQTASGGEQQTQFASRSGVQRYYLVQRHQQQSCGSIAAR